MSFTHAVSICLYPVSKAVFTELYASSGEDFQVPNPTAGMVVPLLSLKVRLVDIVLIFKLVKLPEFLGSLNKCSSSFIVG